MYHCCEKVHHCDIIMLYSDITYNSASWALNPVITL